MKRFALLAALTFAAVSFGGLSPLAFANEDLPPMLRDRAELHDDVIRLGDLWDNLDTRQAETVVAKAPQPGKRISVDGRWLSGIATTHGVAWTPHSIMDRIVLDRPGRTIDTQVVEGHMRSLLESEGVSGPFDLEFTNRSALNVMVAANAAEKIALHDLNLDRASGRFTATLEAPAGDVNAQRIRLSGRIHETARVPVLVRSVGRGSIITERDIKWVDVREGTMRKDAAMELDDVVGLEPRRTIKADSPISLADLQRPVLVTRNSNVTLILEIPGMQLTAQGKALDDGGQGDVVRVTNLQTKRTVDGVVESSGVVRVSLGPAQTPDARIASLGR